MERGSQLLPAAGPGQAVVGIRAVGLNQADYRYVLGTHFPPDHLPSCVAHEAVGEILALGPASDDGPWQVGDRVALLPMLIDRGTMGALREVGIYDQSALLPVPAAYSDEEGAGYWVGLLTMAGALDMAGLGPETASGKTVVFTGAAGGTGTLAVQLARAWGADTVATTRRPDKVKRLSTLATRVLVVERAEDLAAAVRRECAGNRIDAIFDPIGGGFVAAGLDVLGAGGQFVSYEAVSGHVASYDIMQLMGRDQSLHGYTFLRPLRRPGLLQKLIEIGMGWADRLAPILAATYGFDDAPAALDALARSDHVGKITVTL
jgi:NADPH:quinone reductase-like Zn-dependent oxidoreductase